MSLFYSRSLSFNTAMLLLIPTRLVGQSVWHDSFICVTWLIHMCVTWNSQCHALHLKVCEMARSYVCHDSFICVRLDCFILVWCDSFIYVWHDSLICVWHTRHNHAPLLMGRRVLQRVAMCCSVLICLAACCSVLQRAATCCSVCVIVLYCVRATLPLGQGVWHDWSIYVWHDRFNMWVIWLIHMCVTCLIHTCVTWLTFLYGLATSGRLLKITGLSCRI